MPCCQRIKPRLQGCQRFGVGGRNALRVEVERVARTPSRPQQHVARRADILHASRSQLADGILKLLILVRVLGFPDYAVLVAFRPRCIALPACHVAPCRRRYGRRRRACRAAACRRCCRLGRRCRGRRLRRRRWLRKDPGARQRGTRRRLGQASYEVRALRCNFLVDRTVVPAAGVDLLDACILPGYHLEARRRHTVAVCRVLAVRDFATRTTWRRRCYGRRPGRSRRSRRCSRSGGHVTGLGQVLDQPRELRHQGVDLGVAAARSAARRTFRAGLDANRRRGTSRRRRATRCGLRPERGEVRHGLEAGRQGFGHSPSPSQQGSGCPYPAPAPCASGSHRPCPLSPEPAERHG